MAASYSVSSIYPQIPVVYMPRLSLCAIKFQPISINLLQKPTNLLPLKRGNTCLLEDHMPLPSDLHPCFMLTIWCKDFTWLVTHLISLIVFLLWLNSHLPQNQTKRIDKILLIQYFLPAVAASINLICRIAGICFISSTNRMHFEALRTLSI